MPASPVTTSTLELNAVDNVSAVAAKVKGAVGDLSASYSKLSAAIAAAGAALGLFTVARWVEGAIEATAHLHELSIQTGVTVETLSALKRVARDSNTDLDEVARMVQKLSKSMFEFAQTGQGAAAKSWERLGFTQEQVRAGMENMDSFLPEFARKLLATGTATEQVAMAQMLLGKSGAQQLGFLTELADKMSLVGKVTAEQAEQARQFEKAMRQAESGTAALKLQLALGLIPSLQQVITAFNDMKGKQGDFTDFFTTIGTIVRWVATAVGSFWLALKDMGDGIGALVAKAVALARLDFAAIGVIDSARDAQHAHNKANFEAWQAQMMGAPAALPKADKPRGSWGDAKPDYSQLFAVMEMQIAARKELAAIGPDYSKLFAVMEMQIAARKELAAMQKEEAAAAEEARVAAERQNATYEQQAEAVRQLLDPTRRYYEQIAKLDALVDAGKLTREEAVSAIEKYKEEIDKLTKPAEKTDDIARQLGLTFESAFEKAIGKGAKLRDVLQGIESDIARMIVRKSITEPVGSAISDAVKGSGVSDWFKGLFGGAHADGGAMPPNTWNLVGEQGPEMVWSGPGGGSVTPNSKLGGGDTYLIDARGADRAGLAQLALAIRAVKGSIRTEAVAGWKSYMAARGYATP